MHNNNKCKSSSREDWDYLTFEAKVYRALTSPSIISRNVWIQTLHEKDQNFCTVPRLAETTSRISHLDSVTNVER